MKKIGGFFPLHLPEKKNTHNFLSLWNIPSQSHLFFANARSALHQLLVWQKPKVLWLPAYSCMSLVDAASGAASIRFFPLTPSLSPDCAYLKKHIKAGDTVLAIDYFGRNPNAAFLKFVAASPQVTFIEDRAQAMYPSKASWGDFILYSPRKLLGVPDGGILVSHKQKLPNLEQSHQTSIEFMKPYLMRYEDRDESHNDEWYPVYKAAEQKVKISTQSMSRLSQNILESTNPRPLIQKRQANYKTLMKGLKDIALLSTDDCNFAPFGFPIRIKSRKKVAEALHAKGIFAAHHWPELPSSPKEFPAEHRLTAELLTLPVDHRYDAGDMKRIIDTAREIL